MLLDLNNSWWGHKKKRRIWTLFLLSLITGIGMGRAAGATTVVVTESELLVLMSNKLGWGEGVKNFIDYCSVIGGPSKIGYKGGCRYLPILEIYTNKPENNIRLALSIEFYSAAFVVVFAPKGLFDRYEGSRTLQISNDCATYEMPWKEEVSPIFILHIGENPANAELCLFAGFLKYLRVPIRAVAEGGSLEYYKFVYNFIASKGITVEEVLSNVQKKLDNEDIVIEVRN